MLSFSPFRSLESLSQNMFSPRAIRSIPSLSHLFYTVPGPGLGNRSMSTTAGIFTPVTSVKTDRAYARENSP